MWIGEMRRCQIPLFLTEPLAADPNVDGLGAQAEPIGNGTTIMASRITDLRRKNCLATATGERTENM